MEPRPPRSQLPVPAARPLAPDGRASLPGATFPAGAAGYPPQAAVPGAYEGPIPLVPREERRRRRIAWTALLGLLLLAALGAGGYLLRDRLFFAAADPTPAPIAASPASTPGELAAAGATAETPPAGEQRRSVLTPPTPTPAPSPPAGAGDAEPTEPPAGAAGGAAGASPPAETGDQEPAADLAAEDLLPTGDTVLDVLPMSDEGDRDEAAVLASLGDTPDAARFLDEAGWQANPFRNFESADGSTATDNGTTGLSFSVHAFATPEGAADGLVYFSDHIINTDGYEEVDGDQVGDQSRWLRLETDAGNYAVLYARVGSNMVRIGGFSPTGDPAPDVAAVAAEFLQA